MARDPGLECAVRALGSVQALAAALGVSGAAVSQWSRVPAERVPEVARATGLPRHVLRPDLYDAPLARVPARRVRRSARPAAEAPS